MVVNCSFKTQFIKLTWYLLGIYNAKVIMVSAVPCYSNLNYLTLSLLLEVSPCASL